jgi:4-amino-4-deoxy-L-arabinose transferase-like glycosyltransferase
MASQCPGRSDAAVRGDRIARPWVLCGIVGFGVLYGLVHAGVRLAFSENLSGAVAFSNVFAQTLSLGYQERQPPLYEWLVWLVQQATGPNLVSFLLINYGLLTATFVFLYLSALRLFDDQRWAMVASLSPLLLYQIGWNIHEGVTHSLVMTCAIAASFWAFMRLSESGRLEDYVLFGIAAGLGLITKYGFVAYLSILIVCALFQPPLRARLLDARMLASVGIATAIAVPFGGWLLANQHDLVQVFDSTVAPKASDRLTATMTGLAFASFAPLGFLFPLNVILLVMFPALLRESWLRFKDGARPRWLSVQALADWPVLLLHMTLAGLGFLVLGAVLMGASNYLERYMHPFFLLTPLLLLWIAAQDAPARRPVVIGAALLAVTLAVVPIRAVNLVLSMGPGCRACQLAVPYEGLANQLAARGIGGGTIMVMDRDDGGNLRRLFPDARIVLLRRPRYAPPVRPQDLTAPALVVWRLPHGESVPPVAAPAIREIGGTVVGAPAKVRVPWVPLGGASEPRSWEWMVARVKPSSAPQR